MIIKCSASVAVYLSIVFSKKKVFKYGRRSAKSKRKKGSFEKKGDALVTMPHCVKWLIKRSVSDVSHFSLRSL